MMRIEAIRAVAKDRMTRRNARGYSLVMIEAEELVAALEVLGVVKFDDRPPEEDKG